jgi:hypothetical protein
MAGIQISIDTRDLRKADLWLATMTGQLDFVSSRAISATAKSIHANLKSQLPSVVNKPTAWTTRGLLVRYSTRTNLTAAVGFNYGGGSFDEVGRMSNMGVPSGRYMNVLAIGGTRQAKATEIALRRTGLIRSNQFITPGGYGIGKPNSFGNVTGGNYQTLLSRFGANRDIGVTSNAPKGPGSRGRTAAKRKEVDLFFDSRKGGMFAQRFGKGPKGGTGIGTGKPGRPQTVGYRRGIKPAFWVVDQPHYHVQFPLRQIAEAQFRAEVGGYFRTALEQALANPKPL